MAALQPVSKILWKNFTKELGPLSQHIDEGLERDVQQSDMDLMCPHSFGHMLYLGCLCHHHH